MKFDKKETINKNAARVDVDYVAFHVNEETEEHVADYIYRALMAHCMMEFGETPDVF